MRRLALRKLLDFLEYLVPLTAHGHIKAGLICLRRSMLSSMFCISLLNQPGASKSGAWANHRDLIPGAPEDKVASLRVLYLSGEGHYLSAKACLYNAKSGLTPCPGPGGPPLLLGPHAVPRLPSINILLFSGRLEDWQSFLDLFQALIHQDARLTDVERLYYLKSHVQGEAKAVLNTLQLVGSNYSTAWSLLTSRFKHHRLLVHDHITALRTLKTLREESAADLQGLLDTLEKHRDQLKVLKQPVEQWDVWIISFSSTAMDSSTRRAWKDELEKLDAAALAPGEVATFANQSSFLRRRVRSLTSVDASHSLRSASDSLSSRSTSGRPAGPALIGRNYRTLATQAAEADCSACHAPYYIGHCSRFLQLDETARQALVAQSKLCFNCLRSGHIAHSCPSQGVCQHCSERHHSLIHNGSR
ncbi:uncharacterized protein LOC106640886 [Copidosoma floridanum]|uniref:uncharacterized protein LOC106640886 n=1 Tax=Copidosoma floridanum TaxID=29053 RepID=UPI000C6FA5BF|nr:uncharacterized protein LOC106640886 [Copidosoma floridanum]